MTTCTSCGMENPEGFRFCGRCGAALGGAGEAASREERKVVSVLFCDLVGFTASAESADPEDVSRALGTYHALVREQIERFGGILEKFIGDAAVGVWGAPVAHEDDAERAVRAALSIVEVAGVDVRIAVNTGEALVRLSPVVDMGEGLVGDVVNTASRLQTVAPIGGVVVGEATMRATGDSVAYERLEPVSLKGKAEPVAVWQAVAVESAVGERRLRTGAPFVGRATELELLQRVFLRALAEPGFQLVTVVGEPGIGKSRLIAEFVEWVHGRDEAVALHRGQCLAYGDGVGLWPLAEIVKSIAGITETDDVAATRGKLDASVSGLADADWLRTRLAPLVGLSADQGDREEAFSAWQRFFDEVAARAPLVLVVEDLHWATEPMRELLAYLAGWSTGVPMLVVCSTRPELLDSGWAAGLHNATTLALRPLTADESDALAGALLEQAIPGKSRSLVVERCGGNPLYAEEFALLLAQRSASATDDVELPSTVQALIAARIDALPRERKHLLHQAAILGKVFWAGALVAMCPSETDPGHVRAELHALVRTELIRPVRVSSVPGDLEFAFWHDLVQDVAYRQVPRESRARSHVLAAAWIEETAGDRLADRAELIAHHYRSALANRPTADPGAQEDLRASAVRFLAMAGRQALGFDSVHSMELVKAALEYSGPSPGERAPLLALLGAARMHVGELDAAVEALREAQTSADVAGDLETYGEAVYNLGDAFFFSGNGAALLPMFEQASDRLGDEASYPNCIVLGFFAFMKMMRGELHEAERLLARGLELVAATPNPVIAEAPLLNTRGLVRVELGDRGGLEDLERSLATFAERDPQYVPMGKFHLGAGLISFSGPSAGAGIMEEAVEAAERSRSTSYLLQAANANAWRLEEQGAWDALLDTADRGIELARRTGSINVAARLSVHKARVLALRDERDQAKLAMAGALDQARAIMDLDPLVVALAVSASLAYVDGDRAGARALVEETQASMVTSEAQLPELCRILILCGSLEHAEYLASQARPGPPRFEYQMISARAHIAEAAGDTDGALQLYREAADQWRTFGNPFELAHAVAGLARMLEALGRGDEAGPHVEETAALTKALQLAGPFAPANLALALGETTA